MNHWLLYLRNLLRPLRRQEGQDTAEYGLLAALIAVLLIVSITFLGRDISSFWVTVAGLLP